MKSQKAGEKSELMDQIARLESDFPFILSRLNKACLTVCLSVCFAFSVSADFSRQIKRLNENIQALFQLK